VAMVREKKTVLFSKGEWHCCIVKPPDAGVVEEFAASELQKYLSKIADQPIEVKVDGMGFAIRVGRHFKEQIKNTESLGENGFAIQLMKNGIVISSSGEKGVLNGVYEFLEIIGCRWYFPGLGEIVPTSDIISVGDLNIRKKPSFPRIALLHAYEDLRDYSMETMKAIQKENELDNLDWMGKNKFNIDTSLHLNALGPREEWHYEIALDSEEYHEECQKRALTNEIGGHIMPILLPRRLFSKHPEYFPMGTDGKRNQMGNVCCSNNEALDVVRKNAVKMVKEHKGDTLIAWARELFSGGWCSCEKCKNLPVQDQSLTFINAIAEAVEKVRPGIRVFYLAYHDTLVSGFKIKPRDNVVLHFAPRERCYGHPINSGDCEINPEVHHVFKDCVNTFGTKNVCIFEYYGDVLLFCSINASIPWIIGADMKEYSKNGVGEIGTLMYEGYTWRAFPLNLYIFAKVAFDAETNVDDLMLDFVRNIFPSISEEMFSYYKELEDAVGLIIRFHDWRYRGAAIAFNVPVPFYDDRSDYNYPLSPQPAWKENFIARIERALSKIENLQAELEKLNRLLSGTEKKRLQREIGILEITRLFVGSLHYELLSSESFAKGCYEEALDYINKDEEKLECVIARLLEKVDPHLCGTWAQDNQGEIIRIRRLLKLVRNRKKVIGQRLAKKSQ
jgi:hypothetical protein